MSKFLTLNEKDLIKGFIVTIAGTIFTTIWALLTNGGAIDPTTIKFIILGGLGAWFGYLGKNLFTNSEWNIKPEPIVEPTTIPTSTDVMP